MAFRGYFGLNGFELTNSSRLIAHLGMNVPTTDVGIFGAADRSLTEDPPGSGLYIPASAEDIDPVDGPTGLYSVTFDYLVGQENPPGSGLYKTGECQLTVVSEGLYEIPATSVQVPTTDGIYPGGVYPGPDTFPLGGDRQLYTVPDGAVRYGAGLIRVEDGCWGEMVSCANCDTQVTYDDSWPGLQDYLSDSVYRTELAPWYSLRSPQSAEFAGVWVLDVKGLGPAPVDQPLTELVGDGAAAGPARDASRTVSFEALLIGCSDAGVEWGLSWLACRLREAAQGADSTLQFFSAHPSHTVADPLTLVREVHGVALKTALQVVDQMVTLPGQHRQANMYRVTWEFAVTRPHVYAPPIRLRNITWDTLDLQSIQWVHQPHCVKPATCAEMPVLFSATCIPETVQVVTSPPPSCGGCMPLCAFETYVYHLPTLEYPLRCSETAVTMAIRNTGSRELTVQAYWRTCGTDVRCEDNRWPVQISGLPPRAILTLDAVDGRYWAMYEDDENFELTRKAQYVQPGLRGKKMRPVGIVGTPTGAPWQPPILDREGCWELVVLAPPDSDFEVTLVMSDRDA